MFWLQVLELIIELYHQNNLKSKILGFIIKKSFIDVDVDCFFFNVWKMVKIHHQFVLVTSLIFILMFSNKLDKFIMISNIELENFK